jgi:hypothetical protein
MAARSASVEQAHRREHLTRIAVEVPANVGDRSPFCTRRTVIAESVVGDRLKVRASSVGVTLPRTLIELVTANSEAERPLPSRLRP